MNRHQQRKKQTTICCFNSKKTLFMLVWRTCMKLSNIPKLQTLFYFCSQIKYWFSGQRVIKCLSEYQTGKTKIRLFLQTSPFPILGLLGGIFHFYSHFKRNSCKQTAEHLIRRRVSRRLVWFCTVCRCPTKRTLVVYG